MKTTEQNTTQNANESERTQQKIQMKNTWHNTTQHANENNRRQSKTNYK